MKVKVKRQIIDPKLTVLLEFLYNMLTDSVNSFSTLLLLMLASYLSYLGGDGLDDAKDEVVSECEGRDDLGGDQP